MQPDPSSHTPGIARAWMWTGAAFEPAQGLPVTDRGFRYGMSIFESLRIHRGQPLFLDEHLDRFTQSIQAAGLHAPAGAIAACRELFRGASDGFARIYLTAGDGPATAPPGIGRLLVFVEPREPVQPATYRRGYDLTIYPHPFSPFLPGHKTGNYWPNIEAIQAADPHPLRADEKLLISPEDLLVSACMANVFIVSGKRILTPVSHLETPSPVVTCRNGVVREWVLRNFAARTSITFITRGQLEAANEIFLTSSWLGIMPAARLDGRALRQSTGRQILEVYCREFSFQQG